VIDYQNSLTPIQAAKYVGISGAALRLWRSEGKGPRYFKAGLKLIRYRRVDLDSWIEARLVESRSGGKSSRTELVVALGPSVMIFLQRVEVRSFPISPLVEWWWGEIGWLIVLCTLFTAILLLIPGLAHWTQVPMLITSLAQLCRFGALVGKTLRSGWRLARPRTVRAR
jgi:predicted DNA-binding transcriptional regulator AlpA